MPQSSPASTATKLFLLSVTTLLLTGAFACDPKGTTSDTNNFREDVFQCENAVAHFEQCCPSMTAHANVCLHRYVKTESDCGCGGSQTHEEHVEPVWDEATSESVANASCDVLQADDGCQRLFFELAVNNSKVNDTQNCDDNNNNNGPY